MMGARRAWTGKCGALGGVAAALLLVVCGPAPMAGPARAQGVGADGRRAIQRGLDYLARNQSRWGHWEANGGQYTVAMTALAGTAFLCEGSTATQGRYAENIRRAVDFLLDMSHENGLIGNPQDQRYTYGHGFAMLFLSQVLGEEEDEERRAALVDVLTRAVEFSGNAQCESGGWGYVSARDGGGFDEGSTTITQVQGLRGCRNAGIPVPREIIDRAIEYIEACTMESGGVMYRFGQPGERPPITAAAIATLFSAGEYNSEYVQRLLAYCRENVSDTSLNNPQVAGHWHYTHYYYAQVLYRQGGEEWQRYRDRIVAQIVQTQAADGSWTDSYVGPVFGTAVNLTILQLEDGLLPIYQR